MPAKTSKTVAKKSVEKKPAAKEASSNVDNAAGLKTLEIEAKELGLKLVNWGPEKLAQFVAGSLTIARLENISKEKLYEMADVGYRLFNQGKLDDAEKIFSGLTVMDPYDVYFPLMLGSICQRKNDFAKAEIFYSRAIEINVGLTTAFVNRGEVRIMLQNFQGAIEDFSKAIQLDPENKDPAAMRARVMLIAMNNKVQELSAGQTKSAKK